MCSYTHEFEVGQTERTLRREGTWKTLRPGRSGLGTLQGNSSGCHLSTMDRTVSVYRLQNPRVPHLDRLKRCPPTIRLDQSTVGLPNAAGTHLQLLCLRTSYSSTDPLTDSCDTYHMQIVMWISFLEGNDVIKYECNQVF